MRVRGVRRQRAFDRGFVLSDHADWPALLQTIDETGAPPRARHARPRRAARALPAEQGSSRRHPHGVGRRADGTDTDRSESAVERGRRRDDSVGSATLQCTIDAAFADLFDAIDRTTSTNAKVAAMARYFAEAPPADAAWAVFFLTGRRLKRLVPYAAIHDWTLAATGLDAGSSRSATRSSATAPRPRRWCSISCRPSRTVEPLPLAPWVEERILPLRDMDPDAQRARVTEWWAPLDRLQRFMLLKMLTGELRVGVSQTLVVRALAQAAGLPVADRRGAADGRLDADAPSGSRRCSSHEHTDDDRSRPYPFFLASPLDEDAVDARRAGGLAGRVEVGRHPRAADQARRRACTCGRAARS